jgi:hypothetical protein
VKQWLRFVAVLPFALAFSAQAVKAEDGKEYLVKAAFMYNFVKFVEWPGQMSVAANPNVNICVIGTNPFGAEAQQVFAKASSGTLKLNVVERKDGNYTGCHVAFISRSEESRLASIIAQLKGQPVLTVSDIDHFATRGGVIGFITQDNKIKLVVNTASAGAAGLRVDAQLLEIALNVIRS